MLHFQLLVASQIHLLPSRRKLQLALSACDLEPELEVSHPTVYQNLRPILSMSTDASAGPSRLMARDDAGIPSAASFFVSSVPTLPDAIYKFQIYAGDLPARPSSHSAENAHLYFMLHKAKHRADKQRLLIWMNGGPGCSSFDGIMMEVGAWRTKSDGTGLEWAPDGGAWNEYVDVLYSKQFLANPLSFASTQLMNRVQSRSAGRHGFLLCLHKCIRKDTEPSCR